MHINSIFRALLFQIYVQIRYFFYRIVFNKTKCFFEIVYVQRQEKSAAPNSADN